MGAIGSYLANFSDSFKAALVLWPLLSFALTLPLLAYLYHRDGRLRFPTAVAAYLSVLYVAGLGCFTLYPLPSGDAGPGITYGIPPQFDPLNFIFDIQKDGLRAVLQLLFNVALFVPLGFLAKVLYRMGWLPTFAVSLAATCLIETAQLTGLFGLYPYAYRTFEVDDIICNAAGGMLGWFLGALLVKALPKQPEEAPPITHHPGFVRRCVALWLDALMIGVLGFLPWLAPALACEALFDAPLALGGLSASDTEALLCGVGLLTAFAVLEAAIPWLHDGSTLGGLFVRMSCETRPRTGWRRVAFYVARSLTLLAVFAFPPYAIPLLALFYLIARRMPYDFLP